MTDYDVFNGDADGLCALQQLRLAEPRAAQLVTGTKRDIALLARPALAEAAAADRVTVLDISLDRNRAALESLLARGAQVVWFDHHFAGDIPTHARLHAQIDTSPQVCTSILVDRHLGGRYRGWAVAAAFGDGLTDAARALGAQLALSDGDFERLRSLGEALNYNGYGESEADLTIHPAELSALMRGETDPLRFAAEAPIVAELIEAMRADLANARALEPGYADAAVAVYLLPDAAWSRRVSGTFAHALAADSPQRAHAVLTPNAPGAYLVSVRAPRAHPQGADRFCREFGGGGRSGAAGIDRLPAQRLDDFIARFARAFWGQ
jgi:hypothetical protein